MNRRHHDGDPQRADEKKARQANDEKKAFEAAERRAQAEREAEAQRDQAEREAEAQRVQDQRRRNAAARGAVFRNLDNDNNGNR